MSDIQRFEKQNKIEINVFGYEKGGVFPIYTTKQRYDKHVDLLTISDGKKSHYCWIKDFNLMLYVFIEDYKQPEGYRVGLLNIHMIQNIYIQDKTNNTRDYLTLIHS